MTGTGTPISGGKFLAKTGSVKTGSVESQNSDRTIYLIGMNWICMVILHEKINKFLVELLQRDPSSTRRSYSYDDEDHFTPASPLQL